MLPLLFALFIAPYVAAAPRVTPGCTVPIPAVTVGAMLNRQHVGGAFKAVKTEAPETTFAADRRIAIVTFGCRGDYIDELNQEDADFEARGINPARFADEQAQVIVLFLKSPPLPREAIIVRGTLLALTSYR